MSIFLKVAELVRNNFPAAGELHPELHTREIEGWDSFGTMQMVMDLEETFHIEIPTTMIPELDTLGKIAAYVAMTTGAGVAA